MAKQQAQFRNRIVEYGVQPADQFLANPRNARLHPQFQRDVMRSALETVGFVAPVIVAKNGYLIDGHERVYQALGNDNAPVPYVVVDVDDDEADYVLATFDPITGLATYDRELLSGLLDNVNTDSEAVQQMLSQLAESVAVVDWDDAFDKVPTEDREPFQEMSFTLHDSQVETVNAALLKAKRNADFTDVPNQNSNGNALWHVCLWYLNHG